MVAAGNETSEGSEGVTSKGENVKGLEPLGKVQKGTSTGGRREGRKAGEQWAAYAAEQRAAAKIVSKKV